MSSSSAEPGPEPAVVAPEDQPPAPRRPARLRFLVLGFALAGILALVLFRPWGGDGGSSFPRVGDAMPDVSLPALEGGGKVVLPYPASAKLRGTVISFFASWCGPCRTELPMVAELAKRSATPRGSAEGELRFVGIDGLDNPAKAKAFLAEVGYHEPVGADTSYAVTSGVFGFQGLPETVVLGADNTITYVKVGAVSRRELLAALNALPPVR